MTAAKVAGSKPRAESVALPSRGGQMAYLDFGPQDRPVDVVFSHGNGFNARTYASILAPLADELRILAVDMRGHGRSKLPTDIKERRDWSDLVDDLVAFLEAMDVGPVVLAGHSLGGAVSVMAAPRAPRGVRKFSLAEPALRLIPPGEAPPAGGNAETIEGALRRRDNFASVKAASDSFRGRGIFKDWRDDVLADYVKEAVVKDGVLGWKLACDPKWEASNFSATGVDIWGAVIAAAGIPFRILQGERDSTVRLDTAELAKLGVTDVEVTVVPGSDHFLPMERPDVVQAALRLAAGA